MRGAVCMDEGCGLCGLGAWSSGMRGMVCNVGG